jgi:CRISPR-associated protein Csb1
MKTSNETKLLDLDSLKKAVTENAAAFRCRRRLQPAGGEGDKVFPPTFAGAVYAVEQRRVFDSDGKVLAQPVTCVVLDTVQSQANRMEQALQEALDAKRLTIPVVKVDFSQWSPTGDLDADKTAGRLIDAVGTITSLQVPHRLADAILRDSEIEEGKKGSDGKIPKVAFRKSRKGNALNTVSQQNATALYQLCPTALIFGMWDSTGPKGGLGAKFERAVVSEVVGVGASFGIKTASRIDPLITKTEGIEVFEGNDGTWTLDRNAAKKDPKSGQLILLGKGQKKGKVSNANLGNVTPSFTEYGDNASGPDPLKVQQLTDSRFNLLLDSPDALKQLEARKGQMAAGGASIEYAEQLTTLSLIVLRRLRLPVCKKKDEKDDAFSIRASNAEQAGRVVLAALGLCAATLAFESGMGLRSRCLLWPDGAMEWELLDKPGSDPIPFSLTGEQATILLQQAVDAAKTAGLEWEEAPIKLVPQLKLVELVRLSQQKATEAESGDAS